MKKVVSVILSGTLLINMMMFSFTSAHASNVNNLGNAQTMSTKKINGENVSVEKVLPPTLLLLTVAYALVTATDGTPQAPKKLTTGYAGGPSLSQHTEEISLNNLN